MVQYANFLLDEGIDGLDQEELFSTEELIKCFENIEESLDAEIRNNAHKAKLSREYAAKFVANI